MALTWRNVDASGLGASAGALEASGRMFNNAFKGLQSGLNNWQANNIANNDSALIADSLRFQDPAALREALLSGSLMAGRNPTQFSPQALQAVDGRQRELLQLAAGQEQLSNNQYTNQRNRDQNAIQDNARTGVGQLLQAAARNDGAGVETALANNSQALGQLAPDQLSQLLSSTQGLQGGNLRNQGSQFDLNVARRNDADTQAAMAAGVDVQRNAIDPLGLTQELSQRFDELSPGAASQLSRQFPGAFAVGGNNAPAGGGGFASTIPFAETRSYVGNILQMSGEVTGSNREKAQKLMPALIQQESGGDVNAVGPITRSGERAQGSTQVMPATGQNPGYGVSPMKDNSPAEQRRFGEDYLTAMLDKYDGDTERALAAYNAGPGNVDSWIREAPGAGQIDATQAELGQLTMTNNTRGGAAQDLAANFGSNATVGSVAKQLVESDFAGADQNNVVSMLNSIVSRSQGAINPAQAGAILQRNIDTSGYGGSRNIEDLTGNWFMPGVGVNTENVDKAIAAQRSGQSESQLLAGNDITRLSASITQAQENASQARQAYQQAQQQVRARGATPQLMEALDRYRSQAQMAQQSLQNLLDRRQSIPGDSPQ